MDIYEIINILLMVFSSFLFVLVITPFVRKIAYDVGAVDMPNERKVHKSPIPRLGGLGIFMGFLFGYMLFGEPSSIMNSVLIGSFIIILTGIIDDIKPLDPKVKFLGQLIATCIVVFYGNLLIKDIGAFGYYINFWYFSYPLTIFFVLGCINCMNLIDGLDGLSSGLSAIYFFTIGIIACFKGNIGLDLVIAFVMLGSLLGFLVHNFHPATIFAGDSGSMFMGFIIAIVALLGFKNVTLTSLIIPLIILAIPICDTLFAILRRLLKGESISNPDKFHIHHQLLNRNFNQVETVLIIYIVDLLFAFASIIYFLKDRLFGYIIYGILMLIVSIFIVKTNVIFDHKERIIYKVNNKKRK